MRAPTHHSIVSDWRRDLACRNHLTAVQYIFVDITHADLTDDVALLKETRTRVG